MNYPVVIHKDKKSGYGVTVPDLPGCFSAGETIEDALEMAREAIECHLEGMLKDGDVLPRPRTIEAHRSDPDYKGGVWALVSVALAGLSGKTKRINITVPERALRQIDDAAKNEGESRSGFLLRAALDYISVAATPSAPRTRAHGRLRKTAV
jgi:predicted RNase H-like HicB family nuclease